MKILFKALTKKGNDLFEWVKGLPTYDYDGSQKITGMDTGKEYYPIMPETLCQAVGKIDKKGQDVFEKDRLRFIHKVGKKTIEEELTIYFDKGSSQYVLGKDGFLLPLHMYKVEEGEVVGNENNDNFINKKDKKK